MSYQLKTPKQARSKRTLDRIVQATLEVIAEKGVEGAGVQEIVSRARSSVGSFYARFSSKDDLLAYVEERVWDEAIERWDEARSTGAWEGGSLDAVVSGLVDLLVRTERHDAAQRRAFARQGGAGRFRSHVRTDVEALIFARRREITHPEPATAVRALWTVLVGAAREIAESREEDTNEEFEVSGELARLAMAYLCGRTDDGTGQTPYDSGGRMDFFDVWG